MDGQGCMKEETGKDEIRDPLSTYSGQEIASEVNIKIRVKKESETQGKIYRDWHTTEMCIALAVNV